jgi:hypothetical protein
MSGGGGKAIPPGPALSEAEGAGTLTSNSESQHLDFP